MTTRTQSPQMIAISRIAENLAPQVQAALDHLRAERRLLDGYPTQTNGAGTPTVTRAHILSGICKETDCHRPRPCPDHDAPVTLTIVEANAAAREVIDAKEWQLTAEVRGLGALMSDLQDSVTNALRHRAPTPIDKSDKPRCWTGDLEGFLVPITDGGWSRPDCTEIPRRGDTGPCDSCYARHRRWRSRNGLKPLSGEISAA